PGTRRPQRGAMGCAPGTASRLRTPLAHRYARGDLFRRDRGPAVAARWPPDPPARRDPAHLARALATSQLPEQGDLLPRACGFARSARLLSRRCLELCQALLHCGTAGRADLWAVA